MNKLIINKDNYELIMFDLIEGQFDQETGNNLIDQIEADTFLNFEWQQWQKAKYSESLNKIKNDEAAFIENLSKDEEKKSVIQFSWIPYSLAASVLLLIGFYLIQVPQTNKKANQIVSKNVEKENIDLATLLKDSTANNIASAHQEEKAIRGTHYLQGELVLDTFQTVLVKNEGTMLDLKQVEQSQKVQDTVRQMIAEAIKMQRYKVSIVEGPADSIKLNTEEFLEKRYTMLDVLNKKDGISLSKFIQNSNSRIVTDPVSNKTTIEYLAKDQTVLVLTLSN